MFHPKIETVSSTSNLPQKRKLDIHQDWWRSEKESLLFYTTMNWRDQSELGMSNFDSRLPKWSSLVRPASDELKIDGYDLGNLASFLLHAHNLEIATAINKLRNLELQLSWINQYEYDRVLRKKSYLSSNPIWKPFHRNLGTSHLHWREWRS